MTLTTRSVESALRTLRMLMRGSAFEIIQLLNKSGDMTVTEIYNRLNIEQPVASQSLRGLREIGVVTASRDGKFIIYEINQDRYNQIVNAILEVVHPEAVPVTQDNGL